MINWSLLWLITTCLYTDIVSAFTSRKVGKMESTKKYLHHVNGSFRPKAAIHPIMFTTFLPTFERKNHDNVWLIADVGGCFSYYHLKFSRSANFW